MSEAARVSVPCFVWDFTLSAQPHPESGDVVQREHLLVWFQEHCKAWAFQLEEAPTTGYLHWQGRFSLKEKLRFSTLKSRFFGSAHISPTTGENKRNTFYVTKTETRKDGPWTDKDVAEFIPIQHRIETYYPWQKTVVDSASSFDSRTVNVIYDAHGNHGKSTLAGHIIAKKIGWSFQWNEEGVKGIQQRVFGYETRRLYIFDLPRWVPKSSVPFIYCAIEQIKNGIVEDNRYSAKIKTFDSPAVWVFTNFLPDTRLLSADRWKYWVIDHTHTLVPFVRTDFEAQRTETVDNPFTPAPKRFRIDEFPDEM